MKLYSSKSGVSYAVGAYTCFELIKYRKDDIIGCFVSSDINSALKLKLEKALSGAGIYIEVNDKGIKTATKKENVYVVCSFKKFDQELSKNNHLVLVNPANRGNLGTIIRTMRGFDFKDLVIIRPGVDIFHPDTILSSMGSIFDINYKYYASIDDYLSEYGNSHSVYSFMIDGKYLLSQVKFKSPLSLIFGNEGSGLDSKFTGIGTNVKIEQNNNIDSLNLAVSSGIAMYYVYRN